VLSTQVYLYELEQIDSPEKVSISCCLLGRQPHANATKPIQQLRSDHFQPQNRQGFAFELLRKSHGLATTSRLAGSRREFLKLFIPCNLSKRRLLRVSDLYRGTRMSPYFATQSE